MNFKEIFEMKSLTAIATEMQVSAVLYYEELIKNPNNINLEETKYFLLILDKLYQNGFVSPLRDEEYDECLEIYLNNGGTMIRGDMSSGDKAFHVYPELKGTIKKVHYISEAERLSESRVKNHKSLEKWLDGVIDECKNHRIPLDEVWIGLYAKYDGLSVVLEIEDGKVKSAITRGDKELGMGQNKTRALSLYSYENECEEIGRRFGLKCEALVGKSAFKEYNKKFGNNKLVDPRSAATSILNSDYPTLEELQYLCLMPLSISVDGNVLPIPNQEINCFDDSFGGYSYIIKFDLSNKAFMRSNLETIKGVIEDLKMLIDKECEYPCDGIVIRIENQEIKNILGRDDIECINNWERAYKFKPASAKTRITGIEQDIGLMGKVSFTAKVEPVKLKNKTIKSISLGSEPRFDSLNLAIGDEVIVLYDIIPYLTIDATCKKSGNPPIEKITHCPYCNSQLEYLPEYGCGNINCECRVIGRIYNFCEKTNMMGIGEETIALLFRLKLVSSIGDLFRLKKHKEFLKSIDRFGEKSVKNLLDTIDSLKKIQPDLLLGSIGIPNCGRRVFAKALKVVDFDDLIKAEDITDKVYRKLEKEKGFGEKTISMIFEGITDFKDEIEDILSFIKLDKIKKYDMMVCFTNIRNKKFEEFLEKKNIGAADSLTKSVDLLITGPGNSSKIDKANKMNIPIMSISEAYQHFGYTE